MELHTVVNALMVWGAKWAFGEPTDEQLDPILLLWWMRDRVCRDQLPERQIAVQLDFFHKKMETYWLLLSRDDVSVCLTFPGFEVDVLVTCELSIFFQLWLGRLNYHEAVTVHNLQVDAIPSLSRAFPSWFAWSSAAPTVRAAEMKRRSANTELT